MVTKLLLYLFFTQRAFEKKEKRSENVFPSPITPLEIYKMYFFFIVMVEIIFLQQKA